MLVYINCSLSIFFFFFNDTATTEIYTLSLHDALPIRTRSTAPPRRAVRRSSVTRARGSSSGSDRKSTRLNSSHVKISYAVFCLKKKKKKKKRVREKKKKKRREERKKVEEEQ